MSVAQWGLLEQMCQGASDMILTDDNFATIVDAVAQGRAVYRNIRKAINFLLSVIFLRFYCFNCHVTWLGCAIYAVQLLFVNGRGWVTWFCIRKRTSGKRNYG